MGRTTVVRHTPFFEVLEALKRTTGCALCDLETEAQRHYFDNLLYENVNDPGVRAELRRCRGYCPRHAHLLLGCQDAVGVAILYREQVELLLEFLAKGEAAQPRSRWRRRVARAPWRGGVPCPACTRQEEVRRTCVSTLVTWVGDAELRQAYVAAPGPCAPHLLALLDASRDELLRRFLVETQRAKLVALARDLDEFRRKDGEEGRGEPFGAERDAWRRAVALMTGRAGVF